MLSNLKLGLRFSVGFGLLLLLLLSVSIFMVNRMDYLANFTTLLHKHPYTVSNHVLHIDGDIVRIHRTMKDVALAKNDAEIEKNKEIVEHLEEHILEDFEVVSERFLGDRKMYEDARQLFVDWKPIRNEVIALMLEGKREEAAGITKKKGAHHVEKIKKSMTLLSDFAENKAQSFLADAEENRQETLQVAITSVIVALLLGILLAVTLTRSITRPIQILRGATNKVAHGELDTEIGIHTKEEIGLLAKDFRNMTASLKQSVTQQEQQDWLKTVQMELSNSMRGERDIVELCNKVISTLAQSLDAQVGTLYTVEEDGLLYLKGHYAVLDDINLPHVINEGDGIVGQVAKNKRTTIIENIPEGYLSVSSSLGETCPRNLVVVPCVYNNELEGVFELGSLEVFSPLQQELLERIREDIAVEIHTTGANMRITKLLEQAQAQAEELQSQQEELQSQNEELQSQSEELRASEEELKTQREELQVTNEELEEKNKFLEERRREISEKNKNLEIIRAEIEQKARELELSGKYKSEFLANMSHELRTPLNSLLLLSRDLMNNRHGNLTPDDIESSGIIYKSGNDLLTLINEILDLSRIEAGKMEITLLELDLEDIKGSILSHFKHMAEDKKLKLNIEIDAGVPKKITTDPQRLEQILKNLLSNSLKFTESGGVTVSIHQIRRGTDLSLSGLEVANAFAISVTDTGIGIPEDKQGTIFEAFHQVDGGTSRKYEGTGLGLSISRQLVKLLGGEIHLTSKFGEGSTFTIYLPIVLSEVQDEHEVAKLQRYADQMKPTEEKSQAKTGVQKPKTKRIVKDDRENIGEKEKVILIVEDDVSFAKILLKQCREKGFKGVVSGHGTEGLALASQYLPEAIILDNRLPGMNGLEVLEGLKQNPATRHIPVHMMSVDEISNDAFRRGAIGYFSKPVKQEEMDEAFQRLEEVIEKKMKDLLLVEDNSGQRTAIRKLIGNGDVKITEASNAKETLALLRKKKFDCMVLDLGLPDMAGLDLLKKIENTENIVKPPVIIYTGKELTKEENAALQKYSESIIVKGVKSDERLLDETALFLHRMVGNLPQVKQEMILNLYDRDVMFQDKKVLLVDDDMRNTFALSKILRDKGMIVLKAEGGQKALDILDEEEGIDLVLMDIMMPDIDGYEATRRIRKQKRFAKLPVIALTAKAMKDDRDKCIDAGASDYLSKPVDVDRLFSMLRVWLYQ